jgi:hypothetical protein
LTLTLGVSTIQTKKQTKAKNVVTAVSHKEISTFELLFLNCIVELSNTVGMYSQGNAPLETTAQKQVFPQAPSPTSTTFRGRVGFVDLGVTLTGAMDGVVGGVVTIGAAVVIVVDFGFDFSEMGTVRFCLAVLSNAPLNCTK